LAVVGLVGITLCHLVQLPSTFRESPALGLHQVRLLDVDAEPETAPSRLDVLRDEAARLLDVVSGLRDSDGR
jgi:hypothetical protein